MEKGVLYVIDQENSGSLVSCGKTIETVLTVKKRIAIHCLRRAMCPIQSFEVA